MTVSPSSDAPENEPAANTVMQGPMSPVSHYTFWRALRLMIQHHIDCFDFDLDRLSDEECAAKVPLLWGDIDAMKLAIWCAVEKSMVETVRAFGRRAEVQASPSVNALFAAADRGTHTAVLRVLLESFPRLDVHTRYDTYVGDTALHRAAKCGHAANVRVLLAHGASPCVRNHEGLTALHAAEDFCGGGPSDVTVLLTEAERRAHGDGTLCAAPKPYAERVAEARARWQELGELTQEDLELLKSSAFQPPRGD